MNKKGDCLIGVVVIIVIVLIIFVGIMAFSPWIERDANNQKCKEVCESKGKMLSMITYYDYCMCKDFPENTYKIDDVGDVNG